MPRRLTSPDGTAQALFTREELMSQLRVSDEQLSEWAELIGPEGDEYIFDASELRAIAQRVAVLRTGMSVDDVRGVEAAGFLAGYAELAQDAPPGITAHVWRSYAVIVLYQTQQMTALNAYELAEIAQLKEVNPLTGEFEESPDLAKMHIRLLHGMRTEDGEPYLRLRDGTWEHQGLPQCLQKRRASQARNS
jgi:hypothetical protein